MPKAKASVPEVAPHPFGCMEIEALGLVGNGSILKIVPENLIIRKDLVVGIQAVVEIVELVREVGVAMELRGRTATTTSSSSGRAALAPP